MASKIQIKSCLKSELPNLDVGEFAICTDSKEVFIGTENGNLQIANKEDVGGLDDLQTTSNISLVHAVNEIFDRLNTNMDERAESLSIGDLTDVNLSDFIADNGDVLSLNDGEWVPTSTSTYVINLELWGIYNNGLEPLATTNGINNALHWASEKGYSRCKLPKGQYTIDKDSSVNMVSNMTLDLYGCLLKKESNGNQKYFIINIENKENVLISGGIIEGDRYSHDYTTTPGTHEWGTGINIDYSKNIRIENVEIRETTGYGIFIGSKYQQIYTLNKSNLEQGTIDNSGNLINENNWVRSNISFNLSNQNIQTRGYFMICGNGYGTYGAGNEISKDTINLYFYDNEGNYLGVVKKRTFEEVYLHSIPHGSKKFKLSYRKDINGIQNSLITIRTDIPSKWISINNCFIHHSRALGIVGAGGQYIDIESCEISNIGGTAPACGIDIEDGYSLNQNITIRNNFFHDNMVADIIVISARNVLIELNKFNNSVDLGGPRGENYISQYNRYNLSSASGKTLAGDNGTYVIFRYDHFTDAQIFLSGNSMYNNCIFDNMNFILQSDQYLTSTFISCKFNFNKPDVGWSWILRKGSIIFRFCEFNIKCKWYYFRSEAHLGEWEKNNLVFENNTFNTSSSIGEWIFEVGQLTIVNNVFKGNAHASTYYSFRVKANKTFFTGNKVRDVHFILEGQGLNSQATIKDNRIFIDKTSPVQGSDRSEFLHLYWIDNLNINNNFFEILQANVVIRCFTIYAEKQLILTDNYYSCSNGDKARIDLFGALRNSNNQGTIPPLKSVIKNNILDNVSLNQAPTYINQIVYQVMESNVDFP